MTSSGKYLTLTGITLAPQGLRKWSVTDTGDALDATDSVSNGVVQIDVGCIDYDITLELILRTPSSIKAGLLITNLTLYQELNVNPADYVFTQVVVTRPARTVEVRGQKTLTITCKPTQHPTTGVPCVVTVGGA